VALVVGARLNWLLHFGEPLKWPKDVKFILVIMDVCEEEIEPCKPHVGIVGDVERVVEMINKEITINKKAKDKVLKMEAHVVILAEGSPAPVVVSEGANTMDVGRVVLVQKIIFDYFVCVENIIKRRKVYL
jgi:2-hydroxyacyl-CoA lyase 1